LSNGILASRDNTPSRGVIPQSSSTITISRSHAPAWECRGQRASVAGKGRWRVQTAFPRKRVGTR